MIPRPSYPAYQQDAIDSILRHEGFRERPYIDPLAKDRIPAHAYKTIEKYWGELIPTFGHGLTYITKGESKAIVGRRVHELDEELSKYSWYRNLPNEAKSVIIEMGYQLGLEGLKKFHNMVSALELHDYATAADEMLDSLWARQAPGRARELADRIRALA